MCGGYVHKSKYLSYLSLPNLSVYSLIVLMAFMTSMAPLKLHAQDDMPNDEETIIPANNNSIAPPMNIDESDSGSVNDVEEYDG